MMQNRSKQQFIHSLTLTVALGALVGLSGTAAHAGGLTEFNPTTGSTALLPGTVTTTAQYTLGNAALDFASPYSVALGSNTATFTSTVEPTGGAAFEGFSNQVSPFTHTAFDFPIGTHLIDTFDPTTQTPTGPLAISFSAPVGSFGFKSQSSRGPDLETFTFSVYDSSNSLLGTFTTPSYINSTVASNGKSVFIGAGSTSDNISKVVISSVSDASGYFGGNNDFYTGPVSTGAPVPEASTEVSFGLGMLLLGGLTWASFKRKAKSAL